MSVSASIASGVEVVTPASEVCHHTLYHQDKIGHPLGTWRSVDGSYGIRINCCICGKFFGYHPHNFAASDDKQLAAYEIQREHSDITR